MELKDRLDASEAKARRLADDLKTGNQSEELALLQEQVLAFENVCGVLACAGRESNSLV